MISRWSAAIRCQCDREGGAVETSKGADAFWPVPRATHGRGLPERLSECHVCYIWYGYAQRENIGGAIRGVAKPFAGASDGHVAGRVERERFVSGAIHDRSGVSCGARFS